MHESELLTNLNLYSLVQLGANATVGLYLVEPMPFWIILRNQLNYEHHPGISSIVRKLRSVFLILT